MMVTVDNRREENCDVILTFDVLCMSILYLDYISNNYVTQPEEH